MREDAGRGYRYVVPSPRPRHIVDISLIETVARSGAVVIAGGGGGIPVVRDERGVRRGVEAVTAVPEGGETFRGELSSANDTMGDGSRYALHTVQASAGEALDVTMTSSAFDAYLMIVDADGEKLAEDDDSAGGTNARVSVTVPAAGTYTIVANSYGADAVGPLGTTIVQNYGTDDDSPEGFFGRSGWFNFEHKNRHIALGIQFAPESSLTQTGAGAYEAWSLTHTFTDSGTVTEGFASALVDGAARFVRDGLIGYTVVLRPGTPTEERRRISANATARPRSG